MKNNTLLNIIIINFFIQFIVILQSVAARDPIHTHEMPTESGIHHIYNKNTIKTEIIIKEPLIKDKKIFTEIKLTSLKDNKPLLPAEIKEVHTEKIHLLIFDQTLTDYQHIHPTPTEKAGVYQFEWTPKKTSQYRVWADLTPIATGRQEYIMHDLGGLSKSPQKTDKTHIMTNTIGEKIKKLHLTLTFDSPELISEKPVMGKVIIQDSQGHTFSQLEPVMGAFSHIVAINEDFKTIAHMHPMGAEPSNISDRGGPNLEFHFVPNKPGFWKIWVQIKAYGNNLFIPFGVNVK